MTTIYIYIYILYIYTFIPPKSDQAHAPPLTPHGRSPSPGPNHVVGTPPGPNGAGGPHTGPTANRRNQKVSKLIIH